MKLAITKHVLIEYKLPQAKIDFCLFGLDLDIMAMVLKHDLVVDKMIVLVDRQLEVEAH